MSRSTRPLNALLALAVFFVAADAVVGQGKVSRTPGSRAATSPKASATPEAEKPPAPVLYVPGAYQGWEPATAPQIGAVPGSATRFEGYVNFTGGGEQPFKFTDAPDWIHTNYGSGGPGILNPDGQAGGAYRSFRGLLRIDGRLK